MSETSCEFRYFTKSEVLRKLGIVRKSVPIHMQVLRKRDLQIRLNRMFDVNFLTPEEVDNLFNFAFIDEMERLMDRSYSVTGD